MTKKKEERRVAPFQDWEVRAATDDEPGIIVGYAAVFDELSENLGGFREKIRSGAFAKSIEENDVRALFEHDSKYVLGRNRAKTLALDEDDQGLRVQIVPPDTQWSNDLIISMQRGDITQMSFGFWMREEAWDKDQNVRELIDVDLFDVSIVTYPAYPQTSVEARAIAASLSEDGDEATDQADRARMQEQRERFRLKTATARMR